jgi:hypothetical protein
VRGITHLADQGVWGELTIGSELPLRRAVHSQLHVRAADVDDEHIHYL